MRTPGRKDSGWKPAIPSGPRTLAVAESVRYTSRPGRKVGSCGAVAQLGERLGRIEEVVGSIPIGSIDPARPLSPLRKGAIAFEPSTNRPGMRLEPNIRFMTFFEGVVVFFQKKPSNTVDPAWFSHVLSDPDPEREDRPVTSDEERRWDGRETLGRKRRRHERDVRAKDHGVRHEFLHTPSEPTGLEGVFRSSSRVEVESTLPVRSSMATCDPPTPSDAESSGPSHRCSSAC